METSSKIYFHLIKNYYCERLFGHNHKKIIKNSIFALLLTQYRKFITHAWRLLFSLPSYFSRRSDQNWWFVCSFFFLSFAQLYISIFSWFSMQIPNFYFQSTIACDVAQLLLADKSIRFVMFAKYSPAEITFHHSHRVLNYFSFNYYQASVNIGSLVRFFLLVLLYILLLCTTLNWISIS